MKAADIPEQPILDFLRANRGRLATHWEFSFLSMPTVKTAMPPGIPEKVALAKMRSMLKRGLVDGCGCGCRGDWRLP